MANSISKRKVKKPVARKRAKSRSETTLTPDRDNLSVSVRVARKDLVAFLKAVEKLGQLQRVEEISTWGFGQSFYVPASTSTVHIPGGAPFEYTRDGVTPAADPTTIISATSVTTVAAEKVEEAPEVAPEAIYYEGGPTSEPLGTVHTEGTLHQYPYRNRFGYGTGTDRTGSGDMNLTWTGKDPHIASTTSGVEP